MGGRVGVNIGARPDYPLHIQMLFTARPPLPYLKPPLKPKCRPLDPIVTPVTDYLQKFEEEQEQVEYVPPKGLKQ